MGVDWHVGGTQHVTTQIPVPDRQVLDKMRFAAVLIDEAGQATELATVVPLTRGCQQVVLVGDHYQLPPTVSSDDAKQEGLCVSLFERLALAGVEPALLDTQ